MLHRCEVSAEAPLFNTVSQSKRLQVKSKLKTSNLWNTRIRNVISKLLTSRWWLSQQPNPEYPGDVRSTGNEHSCDLSATILYIHFCQRKKLKPTSQAWGPGACELHFIKQPPSSAPQMVHQWQAGEKRENFKDWSFEWEGRCEFVENKRRSIKTNFQADPHTLRHYPLIQHENGLQTAILGLNFQVQKNNNKNIQVQKKRKRVQNKTLRCKKGQLPKNK